MKHKFVEYMPEKLLDDVLYISTEFNLAKHKCACGCGKEIVTSLSPVGWTLIYNGDTVSLKPSIGNWQQPCKSHYYITKDEIVWLSSFESNRQKLVIEKDIADRKAYSSQRKKTGFFRKILQKYFSKSATR